MEGKKIRILHVAQSAGGVDRYIRMLLKYIDYDKFENILVCSFDFKKENYNNLVTQFEQIKMHRNIGVTDLNAIVKIRKLIKKYNIDIVYAHSSKAGVIARIADIGLENICIYNPHGFAFNMRCSKLKKFIYKKIEKIVAPLCDKIICISDAEKQSALKQKICSEDKLQVIYNGVDVEAYDIEKHGQIQRSSLHIPNDAFVIGMIGRISLQKAPDIFIKVAIEVKRYIHNAYFIIVGNGEMEEEIRRYAQKNGLGDCLIITGWVSNPMSYAELFDVATLLSRWEGFGLALPEYMLVNKPIVATNIDAIPYIITDRKNGLLVNVDDVDGIVEAIKELYSSNQLAMQLVKDGEKCVRDRFDVKRMVLETEEMIQELTKI